MARLWSPGALPPRPGKGPDPEMVFIDWAEGVIAEWVNREKQTGLSPSEAANGFLKRESYRLICHYIEGGAARLFERVIRDNGKALSSVVRLADNPFHYGLSAMFARSDLLSSADRSVYASQMVYAYRHGVPPNLLVGFLYQCGSFSGVRRKLKDGVIEAGFEEQFRAKFPI